MISRESDKVNRRNNHKYVQYTFPSVTSNLTAGFFGAIITQGTIMKKDISFPRAGKEAI